MPEAEKIDAEVDELKPGTTLLQGQYTIIRFINAGGFGFTYLARNSLDREVVIKECFPSSFCRRNITTVMARSRAHQNEFAHIVKLFAQEARGLSRLIHPNIIGVHQVFEDNGTAYMAMDYIDGRDLMKIISQDRASLTPAVVETMLRKLLDAIRHVHDNRMLHRDIAPDNILFDKAGEPVLIDFGAARQEATTIGSRALSALRVVKDGYSPQEFYVSGSQQSNSSDLYALAATFYHVVTGRVPPTSQTRLLAVAEGKADPCEPIAGAYEGYSEGFLEAIDKAINVLPKDRIQSAQEWLDWLDGAPKGQAAAAAPGVKRALSNVEAETAVARLIEMVTSELPREPAPASGDAAPVAARLEIPPPPPLAVSPYADLADLVQASTVDRGHAVDDAERVPLRPHRGLARNILRGVGYLAAAASIAALGFAVVAMRSTPAPAGDAVLPAVAGAEAVATPKTDVTIAPGSLLVRQSGWTVRLPAAVAPDAGGLRVMAVDAEGALLPGNDWLTEGTTIRSVNGIAVRDEAALLNALSSGVDAGGPAVASVPAEIVGPAGPRSVTLAATSVFRVTLADGTSFETLMADSAWRTIVTAVPASLPEGLEVGDVLLTEQTTGAVMNTALVLDETIRQLAAGDGGAAVFAVMRRNTLAVARLPLPREG